MAMRKVGKEWLTNGGNTVHVPSCMKIRKIVAINSPTGFLFWLYRNGTRLNENGSYETSYSFFTLKEAKEKIIELQKKEN